MIKVLMSLLGATMGGDYDDTPDDVPDDYEDMSYDISDDHNFSIDSDAIQNSTEPPSIRVMKVDSDTSAIQSSDDTLAALTANSAIQSSPAALFAKTVPMPSTASTLSSNPGLSGNVYGTVNGDWHEGYGDYHAKHAEEKASYGDASGAEWEARMAKMEYDLADWSNS